MSAGRPHNSTTPVWKSKPAVKIRAYMCLKGRYATKCDCAREIGLSRTTVYKWWGEVANYDYERMAVWVVIMWKKRVGYGIYDWNIDLEKCSEETNFTKEEILLEIATIKELLKDKWFKKDYLNYWFSVKEI